ncbi:helix-turn-helix domain-containing protein [Actinoplanes sp. HUAS TT8]|uniref:AraC family transcriptional regulator n=1 Tax=Actinoplanes sp. HUAS TT8 TaxID=3447453 RepID=UPI003F5240E6
MVVNDYAQAGPAPGLRGHVAFYSGYRQHGLSPGRHRGLPSPYLTLIFTMDEPLVITEHPDRRQAPGSYDALLGGLHRQPAMITHDGSQSGVQVALHPLGCRELLGLPAAELADLDVDPAAVLGERLVAQMRERLCAAPDWPARFAVLDEVLGRRLFTAGDRGGAGLERIAHVWGGLRRGDTPVAALAGEVGWSARHLTDRFRAEVGLRPKEAARIARFDRARRALRPGVRLADLAAEQGYADQSHLVRDFQAFAGCAPSRWLADEFGFVQAAAAAHDDDEVHD